MSDERSRSSTTPPTAYIGGRAEEGEPERESWGGRAGEGGLRREIRTLPSAVRLVRLVRLDRLRRRGGRRQPLR
ncbi:hypothetical protein [uncultured Porphyromonas sp.]|uniref:hypothetical protein n=1 Tax=uncultured Porphyromonas sp. TaxID=159274 RepID=UPI00261D7658|nr:hypothetical protein [uncultured Porphyromonas sp.]